jgi:hypothetical protein
MASIDGASQRKERRCGGSDNLVGWRGGPAQCDEHDNEGHDDNSCGGRAGRSSPLEPPTTDLGAKATTTNTTTKDAETAAVAGLRGKPSPFEPTSAPATDVGCEAAATTKN